MSETINDFICPNCNSKEILEEKFVSIAPSQSKDPWTSVSQIIKCAGCKKNIPAHLGERWDNITFQNAKEEFKKYNK